MKRPLVVFGVALAAILAPSVPVRAQACASGQTLLKNDVLPVNPGMQSVSVITGLCEGEAAGCVFDFTSIATLEKALAFNVSGHVLHSTFWQNLGPKMGGEPGGELAEQIKKDFGSFAIFKKQLNNAAATVMLLSTLLIIVVGYLIYRRVSRGTGDADVGSFAQL